MRSWIPLGALAFVIASGAATAQMQQMQTPPEHQRQPQPQAQPHDGGSSQPIDHQKERARQQDGEPGRIDGQPGNTAGRTPENGQAIPLAPSNESTAQVAPGYPGA